MAADLKAEWTVFNGAVSIDFTVWRAGVVLYTVPLPGDATEQVFFAADYPTLPYAAHVEPRYSQSPCSLSVVEEGGSSSGSGSGGGGS